MSDSFFFFIHYYSRLNNLANYGWCYRCATIIYKYKTTMSGNGVLVLPTRMPGLSNQRTNSLNQGAKTIGCPHVQS